MTEYWVSQGNKWCDYCKIFISKNATSVRTHELGTRHKDNVAKKLAGIRKETATKERERQLASKDLGRIEVEAKKSYERDLAAMQRSSKTGEKGANARHRGSATGGGTSQVEAKDVGEDLSPPAQASTGKRKPIIQLNKDDRRSTVPKASSASRPQVKSSKGVASSLEVGKRKRVEKPGVSSSEEAAARMARESARKRMQEREKSLLGLYHG